MSNFPVQNIHASSSKVLDNVLGTMHFSESGAGCMAYALFATTYTYSYSGKTRICEPTGYKTVKVKDKKGNTVEEKVGQFTAARAKEFILRWADPGEHIRYDAPHSLVFLGEADENGFYCISYGGGARRNHNPNHTLQVEYRTYASIASKANGSLRIRDANNGSYRNGGSVKKWADVKATKNNKKSKTIIRLHCPVEASVTLDGFVLDSEYGPFERSFGTVTRVGDGVVFTLDYSEELVLDIRGTGEGPMNAEIEYLDESGISLGSQRFDDMPIVPDTAITSGALTPESTVVLYYLKEDIPVSAWGTNLGEIATGPSEDFLSVNNTPDEKDEEDAVSDSGSSSSSVSKTVSVGSSANGSVTASPKNASKGDTVTVAVRPNTGYQLDTITVTDQTGKKITLTDNGDGTFSFTMPASSVTVKAAFKPAAFPVFTDVPSGSYYEEAVRWAAENGATAGTDSAHFSPDGICTRAQAVTFLWRAAGSPAPKSSAMPFTDVPAGSYYYNAVLWAVENGISKGTSDTAFSPDKTCTRAQIVTFLWRSQNAPAAGSSNPFADVAASDYYAGAVLWAVKNDITKGTGATTFSPDADCTRAQIVTFLLRTLA